MNLQEFANKHFEGDIDKSLQHLARESYLNEYTLTGSKENLSAIVTPLTGEYSKKFYKYFKQAIKERPGLITEAYKDVLETIGPRVSFSYDEVKNAKVNPYKSKVNKSCLKTLIGGGGLLSFAAIAQGMGDPGAMQSLSSGLATLFGSYMAFDLGINLMNYLKFKKEKKKIDSLDSDTKNNGGMKL